MAQPPKSPDTGADPQRLLEETTILSPPSAEPVAQDAGLPASSEEADITPKFAQPAPDPVKEPFSPDLEAAPDFSPPDAAIPALAPGEASGEIVHHPAPPPDIAPPDPASDPLDASDEPLPSSFEALGLEAGPLLRALERLGWAVPTRVQARAFGPVAASRDVLVQSQTGTGKTGAFCIPWLATRFVPEPASQTGVQLLVLVPTRELAKQVCDQLVALAHDGALVPLPLYGGTAIAPQLDALKAGVHAVVGTPGRILDHIRRRTLKLDQVGMVVLDEADEMLSMGFLEDIHAILDACPKQRQTCLFSATVPSDVERIARRYMRNPLPIRLSGDQVAASQVQHTYYTVSGTIRSRDLLDIIALEEPATALIFCNTREETNLVANVLRREGYLAEALSSDLSQGAREKVLGQMRAGRLRFLVATDVASRGIDISHISHVINYTFPENAESYIHRTGRTGRAGRAGVAISLIAPQELGNFYYLKLQYASLSFEQRELPPAQELEARRTETKLDQISSRFPDLVSPEWRLLARNLMSDPRGEHVVAFLLSEAMSKPIPTPSIVAEAASYDEGPSRSPASYGEEGGRRRGRFRRDRDRGGFEDEPRRHHHTEGTARAAREDLSPVSKPRHSEPPHVGPREVIGAAEEATDADAAETAEQGELRRRRRRRRRGPERDNEGSRAETGLPDAHAEALETSEDAEGLAEPAPLTVPLVEDMPSTPLSAVDQDREASSEADAPSEDPSSLVGSENGTQEVQGADAGAMLDSGRRRRRRRRRRKRKGEEVAAEGADAASLEDTDEDGDDDASEDEEDSGTISETLADEDDASGSAESNRRRRRRRGQRRRPRAEVAPQVSQDQIVIDIDESELEIVRDEFGEIDELDDLTLKGRRRGVIDALEEEVELEDLSDRDTHENGSVAGSPAPEADAGDGSSADGDDENGEGTESEDGDDADLSEDEAKRRKRRRRRRRKKKPEVAAAPELTAPPHKDFWEVWAAKFTYREFEDEVFRGGVEAVPEEAEEAPPPPTPVAPRRPSRAPRPAATSATPVSAPVAALFDGDEDFIHCALNIGRVHGKKSAHIRELLAADFELTGKSIRDLTVGDDMTHFRVGSSSFERLSAGMLGYVFDDVELVLTRLDPPSVPDAGVEDSTGGSARSTAAPSEAESAGAS